MSSREPIDGRQAFVGVGANLGDRETSLRQALARVGEIDGVSVIGTSSVYETEPVGVTAQPRFLNGVIGLVTTLAPEELLRELLRIEGGFGRVRTLRWGPRTLDLDLLAYEGETRRSVELELPHPRMFERSFVIVPLRELLAAPEFDRPAWSALKQRVAQRLADEADVSRRGSWR